jgi:ribosome modulation factor
MGLRTADELAFAKGHAAALAGQSESDCPYRDHRTWRGSVTYARVWRNHWFKGFRAGQAELAA